MAEVMNLRRARKTKARDAKATEATNNRVKHGVSKNLRTLAQARQDKTQRDLDAHKLKDK
jgi:hypothetical protein